MSLLIRAVAKIYAFLSELFSGPARIIPGRGMHKDFQFGISVVRYEGFALKNTKQTHTESLSVLFEVLEAQPRLGVICEGPKCRATKQIRPQDLFDRRRKECFYAMYRNV